MGLVLFILIGALISEVGSVLDERNKTIAEAPAPPTAQDHWRDLEAWDCGDPHDAQAVYVAAPEATCAEGTDLPDQQEEPVEVIIAQRSQTRKVDSYECGLIQSNLAFYCGATDHMTFAHWVSDLETPQRVSLQTCQEWWRTKQFTDTAIMPIRLKEGQTIQQGYCTAGGTYWSSEVECDHGEIVDYKGRRLTSMVNWRQSKITLEKSHLYLRGNTVIDADQRRLLDCSATAGHCVTAGKTRYWEVPAPTSTHICDLHQARRTRGVIRTSNGTKSFIAREAGLRLELKEELIECGARVWTTNFPDLVVTKAVDHKPFQRKLPTEEHSKLLYVDAQDAFLDGKAKDSFDAYAGRFQQEQCRQDTLRNKMGYGQMAAEQRGATAGEIVIVGPGTFAQPAGEVWYRFTCRRVVARAKDLGKCYATMPVDLNEEDLKIYYAAQGLEVPPRGDREQLFLEPHTHIVTPQATERPCVPVFGGVMFQNIHNRWIKASPAVHLAVPPLNLHKDHEASQPLPPYELTNMEEAGLYTPEMKRNIHWWTMFPYLKRELTAGMATQAFETDYGRRGQRGLPHLQNMAAGVVDPSLLEAMTAWVDALGHAKAASITILVILIVIVGGYFGSLCCRAKGGRQHPEIATWMHYFTIVFPSFLHVVLRRLRVRVKDLWDNANRFALGHEEEGYLRMDNLNNQARQEPDVTHGPAAPGVNRALPTPPQNREDPLPGMAGGDPREGLYPHLDDEGEEPPAYSNALNRPDRNKQVTEL